MENVVRFRSQFPRVTSEEALDSFVRFRRASGVRQATDAQYRFILSKFFRDYPDAMESPRECALAYLGESNTDWTRQTRLKVLKVFFGFLMDEGHIHEDPLRGVRAPIPPKKTDVPGMDEVKTVLETLDRDCFAQDRLRVMILLCLETGLRRGEVCALRVEDVDMDTHTLSVRPENTKTKRGRIVPLSPGLIRELRRFLQTRPQEWKTPYVFPSEKGEPLKPGNLTLQVRRLAQRTGVPIHPHALRHLCCTAFLRATGNIALTARLLGHSNIRTTSAFYEHLEDADLREAAGRASILGGFVEGERVRKRNRGHGGERGKGDRA